MGTLLKYGNSDNNEHHFRCYQNQQNFGTDGNRYKVVIAVCTKCIFHPSICQNKFQSNFQISQIIAEFLK